MLGAVASDETLDSDEMAFSVRASQRPNVLDEFSMRASFTQKGVTYRVVGHQCEVDENGDLIVTITGRMWPPDPVAEEDRRQRRVAEEHRRAHPRSKSDMGYVPYFAPSRAKVLDAKARTEALRADLDEYLSKRPWSSETATDGSGRRYWQILRFEDAPPLLHASMALSDISNKLRGALDNWIFDTVKQRLGTDRHDRDIAFPISVSEEQFDRWAARQRWLTDSLRDRLRERQPFGARSQAPLAWLQQLSNHDKHRVPASVGMIVRSGSFGIVNCPDEVADAVRFDMRLPQGFVEDGTRHGDTTLSITANDLRLAHELDLDFGIAVHGEARELPVHVVLGQMAFVVDALLSDLGRRF